MEIVNCDQKSPEWFEIRKKKMTASNAQAIAANGKGLNTYIMKIMQEHFSRAKKVNFTNKDTERGNELEDSAGFLYSMKTGIETEKVGFVIYDEFVGCSPDLFAGQDGLVEIKCPDDKIHFDLLLNDKVDTAYIWQMQMQMLICERAWCDFVAYNPNFDQNKELIIKRFYPDPVKFAELKAGFETGKKLMREISH